MRTSTEYLKGKTAKVGGEEVITYNVAIDLINESRREALEEAANLCQDEFFETVDKSSILNLVKEIK